jgi:Zn-dependent protease with chaperone function
MIFGLLGVALALLYLPLFAFRLGRRLPPRDWSRMATACLISGGLALLTSLLFIAAPPVLRAIGAGELAQLCDEFLGHLPHGTPLTGWMAASLLSVSLGLGISSKFKTTRRLHELTVEPFVGTHVQTPDFDLVLLPSQARLAYSRHAARPQVVITEGLLQLLTEEEFRIMLRHEAAHLRYHHERELQALTVLRFALRWLPGINGSVSIARLAMERLADEEATGPGRPLRAALARALLVTVSGAAPDPVPAFNHAQGLVERVQAMRTTAPPLKRYQEIGLKFAATFMRASVSAGGLLGVLLMTGVCLR